MLGLIIQHDAERIGCGSIGPWQDHRSFAPGSSTGDRTSKSLMPEILMDIVASDRSPSTQNPEVIAIHRPRSCGVRGLDLDEFQRCLGVIADRPSDAELESTWESRQANRVALVTIRGGICDRPDGFVRLVGHPLGCLEDSQALG